MKHRKQFMRVLFFVFLLACLLTGLAGTVRVPVRAAPQMQAATDIVISELRARGSAGGNDDFIELYNPTNAIVNLNGWTINRSNDAGNPNPHYAFITDVFLQPGQHYLLANTSYDDSMTADTTYGTGITDAGGVALIRPDSSIADQVGLGSASAYKEGTPLNSLGSGVSNNIDRSYERNR